MTELRVAIIGGAGFMGFAHSMGWELAPIAAASELSTTAELSARPRKVVLVEATEERASRTAVQFGWEESSADWRSVVTRDDIDIVDICTPPASHREIALAAIAAGKHVFLEKPMSNELADALAIAEAAAARPELVTQVGYCFRFTPAMTFVKKLLDDGTLGRPLQIRVEYLSDESVLGRVLSGWRAEKSTGGSGVQGDNGSHIVDLAQYLVGNIARVNAMVRVKDPAADSAWLPEEERRKTEPLDDAVLFMAEFANGAIGSFAVNKHSSGRKNNICFKLECTKGAVEFDWNRREEVRLSLVSDPPDQQGLRTIIVSEEHDDVWWPVGGMGLGYVEGTSIMFQRFVNSICAGAPGHPNFVESVWAEKVDAAVLVSGDSGEWVDVDAVT